MLTLFEIPVPLPQTYAPEKWRENVPKDQVAVRTDFILKLSVKYYPPCPYKFDNPVTRLQFYLSIRSLVIEGEVTFGFVSPETALAKR